jgi:hypothetical protein
MAFTIKILDSLYFIFAIMVACAVVGYVISRAKNRRMLADIGWGMLYGSLIVIILSTGFLIWLAYNFPK